MQRNKAGMKGMGAGLGWESESKDGGRTLCALGPSYKSLATLALRDANVPRSVQRAPGSRAEGRLRHTYRQLLPLAAAGRLPQQLQGAGALALGPLRAGAERGRRQQRVIGGGRVGGRVMQRATQGRRRTGQRLLASRAGKSTLRPHLHDNGQLAGLDPGLRRPGLRPARRTCRQQEGGQGRVAKHAIEGAACAGMPRAPRPRHPGERRPHSPATAGPCARGCRSIHTRALPL